MLYCKQDIERLTIIDDVHLAITTNDVLTFDFVVIHIVHNAETRHVFE